MSDNTDVSAAGDGQVSNRSRPNTTLTEADVAKVIGDALAPYDNWWLEQSNVQGGESREAMFDVVMSINEHLTITLNLTRRAYTRQPREECETDK